MTSPERSNLRRVDVRRIRGTNVSRPPGANPRIGPGPFDDQEVEIFRADQEWFAPWVDGIDREDPGFGAVLMSPVVGER